MKVKKFVQEIESINGSSTSIPILISGDMHKEYSISNINYSQNTLVKLIAGSKSDISLDEFNKILAKISTTRSNATIVVHIADLYHIDHIKIDDGIIKIIIGGEVKK